MLIGSFGARQYVEIFVPFGKLYSSLASTKGEGKKSANKRKLENNAQKKVFSLLSIEGMTNSDFEAWLAGNASPIIDRQYSLFKE